MTNTITPQELAERRRAEKEELLALYQAASDAGVFAPTSPILPVELQAPKVVVVQQPASTDHCFTFDIVAGVRNNPPWFNFGKWPERFVAAMATVCMAAFGLYYADHVIQSMHYQQRSWGYVCAVVLCLAIALVVAVSNNIQHKKTHLITFILVVFWWVLDFVFDVVDWIS